jgi:predicted dehydrogenase
MKETLRVAVVGCGYWGPNLIRNFSATPGMEVAYACDLDPQRLAEMSRQFKVTRTTSSVGEILEDPEVDAVALATPLPSHVTLGEAVLKAGKHLWVEKPLTATVKEAEHLAALARERDLRLFVDHTFLYTPAVRKLRELFTSGEMGELLYFDSVRINLGLFHETDNVLWDLAPHDLSIAQYVMGRLPREVSAFGARHIQGAPEDLAHVSLRYEGNLVAHFHFSWLAPVKVRRMMIGASRRMVIYDDMEQLEKVKVFDRGVDLREADADPEKRRRALVSYRTGDIASPRLDTTEALSLAVRDFQGAIREGRDPLSGPQVAIDVVRVLEAAQHSMDRDGAWVRLSS